MIPNPFLNKEEQRMRALFRIFLFLTLFIFLVGFSSLIPPRWLGLILASVFVFGLYFGMIKVVDVRPWNQSGLVFNRIWMQDLLAGIAIAAVVMSLIFLVEWLSGGLEITGFGWQRSGKEFWLLPVLSFMIQMMSVGFYEEVMARGYLLRNLSEGFRINKINPKTAAILAVIVSSAIFSIGHAGNPNATMFAILNILVAGIMLAIPFVITGRLALSIGIHFSWNFFQGGVFGFSVSGMAVRNSIVQINQLGQNWWTGGAFGPEGGLIGVIGIILIIFITILYLKLRGEEIGFATSFVNKYSPKI